MKKRYYVLENLFSNGRIESITYQFNKSERSYWEEVVAQRLRTNPNYRYNLRGFDTKFGQMNYVIRFDKKYGRK